MSKNSPGNFFEDFRIGQVIRHATPRTVTIGDVALYTGLFGARFAVQSSDAFAKAIGYPRSPIDDLLVFHIVFGKTVPDVSLNAVANLGYANCCFRAPVYPGDTLSAQSEVIGLKENSSRKTGIVYVRTTGYNQDSKPVLEYVRWVMVRKRDEAAPAPGDHVPRLPTALEPKVLGEACPPIDVAAYDLALAGSPPNSAITPSARRSTMSTATPSKRPSTDRDAALSEHRAHPFRSVRRQAGPLRPPADLWRPCHFARPRAVVQRARQCIPCRRHQWRPPRRAAVRRRHGLCVVGSPGQSRTARPHRCRRAAAAHRRHVRRGGDDFPLKTGDDYDPAVLLDLDYWVLMVRDGVAFSETRTLKRRRR